MNQNKTLSYNVHIYIVDYLKIQRNFSKNTISTYSYGFMKFIKFLKSQKIDINTFEITHIDYNLLLEYITFLRNEKNCSKTINNRIAIIKSFVEYTTIKFPEMLEIYRQLKQLKKIKEEVKIHKYLTIKEIHLIINEAKDNIKYLTMIAILYNCALRVSELANLKVDDMNLNNNTFIIIENGKGNKSRKLPLSKEVTKILNQYLKVYKPKYFVFENKYNTKYSNKGVSYIFEKYYNKAKEKCKDKTMFNPKPHCHLLRHSRGVHMVDAGISLFEIKEFFGHSSISTTEIYARSSQEQMKKILENSSLNKKINIKRSEKEQIDLELFLKNNIK
jgi:integrase/recombinase XerD